jgi:hypothetical protein
MKLDIEILTKIINIWDPIGLLASGAPENEYSIEIKQIMDLSIQCKTEIDLARIIRQVFQTSMGLKINSLACLQQAFVISTQARL